MQKIYKRLWPAGLFLFLPLAESASTEGIPFRFVFFQMLNFSIFAGLLFFLVHRRLSAHFAEKKKDFLEYRTRASELEAKRREESQVWEKKLRQIKAQQKSLAEDVKTALSALEKERASQERFFLKNLSQQRDERLKIFRLKEMEKLKKNLISKLLLLGTKEIEKSTPEVRS